MLTLSCESDPTPNAGFNTQFNPKDAGVRHYAQSYRFPEDLSTKTELNNDARFRLKLI